MYERVKPAVRFGTRALPFLRFGSQFLTPSNRELARHAIGGAAALASTRYPRSSGYSRITNRPILIPPNNPPPIPWLGIGPAPVHGPVPRSSPDWKPFWDSIPKFKTTPVLEDPAQAYFRYGSTHIGNKPHDSDNPDLTGNTGVDLIKQIHNVVKKDDRPLRYGL